MNPFISFCLYVAARVFVQYLKSRPDDNQTGDSLRFLLSAMNAMKSKNPLTESFLVQLDVDLESLGLRVPKFKSLAQNLSMGNLPATGYTQNADGTTTNHCAAILKMVDDKDLPGTSAPQIDPALNNLGLEATRNSPLSANSMPQDFESMPWLSGESGIPLRSNMTNVHPVAMAGMLAPQSSTSPYEMRSYGHSESGTVDMDLSDNLHSDRPTPNSSTPSDTRSSNQAGSAAVGRNGSSSFETSPASSHQDGRSANTNNYFNPTTDYSNSGSGTGMTPGSTGYLPSTPGTRNDFSVPNGWELSNQGLTPVGEGVFRELMGMGPMDMGWDGTGG
jgi:hypothetical protein